MACSTASSFAKLRNGSPGHGINIQAMALHTNRVIEPRTEPRTNCLAMKDPSFDDSDVGGQDAGSSFSCPKLNQLPELSFITVAVPHDCTLGGPLNSTPRAFNSS